MTVHDVRPLLRRAACRRLAATLTFAVASASVAAAVGDAPSTSPSKDVADMDLDELAALRVSPFDVSVHLDDGYRASNSVSGSRFDAPIRDLPFAIQVFTKAFIQDQKPRDIFDVARYSPGVTYRSNDFNEGNANLAIRGFAVSSTPGNVQILRDGFHGPSFFDFTNISRVEVVKGPASFLYGQVAPGGIVNIITKSPQHQFAAVLDARLGSYGQRRVEVDVTGPASSTLFYRLSASHDDDMHYWDAYDARSRNVAPTLLWQPNASVSVSIKYEDFLKHESPQLMQKPGYGRQTGLVPSASDPNLSGVDVPGLSDRWNSMSYADFRRSRSRGLSTWVDLRAGEQWNLRAGYARQDYEVDALFSGNLGMANNTTFLQGRRFRGQTYTNHDETIEVQGVGDFRFDGTSLRLLVGAQHVNRRFDNWAAQAPNDPALGSDPTASPLPLWDLRDPATWNRVVTIPRSALTANATDRTSRFVDKSLYLGSTFGFLEDRLLVLGGWRRTSTNSEITNHLSQAPPLHMEASAVTPQVGVLYKLSHGLSIFGSYAQSFVPGSQLLTDPNGSTRPSDPTKGKGFDLGLKADLFDGRVSGTLSVFDIRNQNIVNDLAQTDPSGSVQIYNVQSGEQRSRGVELDATARLSQRWQLYVSYSSLSARITEFSGNDAAILAQDPATLDAAGRANYKTVNLLHNARLQMSAPHLANLWTRYDFSQQGWSGLYLAGGANVVVDQTILPDGPASSRQTYTLVNAMVGRTWNSHGRNMSVELMGKNLTNAHYRPSQSTRARPRELLLTFRLGL